MASDQVNRKLISHDQYAQIETLGPVGPLDKRMFA